MKLLVTTAVLLLLPLTALADDATVAPSAEKPTAAAPKTAAAPAAEPASSTPKKNPESEDISRLRE